MFVYTEINEDIENDKRKRSGTISMLLIMVTIENDSTIQIINK